MDQPRPVLGGHEGARHDQSRRLIVGQRNHVERAAVAEAQQLAAREGAERPELGEARRALGRAARQGCARRGEDEPVVAHLVLAVLHLGMYRDRDVGQ